MPRASKLQSLNRLVDNFVEQKLPDTGTVDVSLFAAANFAKAILTGTGRHIGISRAGGFALNELCEDLVKEPHFERSVAFDELVDETFHIILARFFDSARRPLGASDLANVEADLCAWLTASVADFTIYAPCMITRAYAPSLTFDPVKFIHIDDFRQCLGDIHEASAATLIRFMEQGHAFWMASVKVAGKTKRRAQEDGDLAIDLALASLQLVVPLSDSRRMARLHGRSFIPVIAQYMELSGAGSIGLIQRAPGLSLQTGLLPALLLERAELVETFQERLEAFLQPEKSATPTLDRAWADAAYWFHEGIAEALDSVAVPKLETAIEILMRAESTKRSKERLMIAIKAFYALERDQNINSDSLVTVEEFVHRFVTERSRILHGTFSTLGGSYVTSRNSLAELAAGLLRAYSWHLSQYQTVVVEPVDDRDAFLDWVQLRTAQRS